MPAKQSVGERVAHQFWTGRISDESKLAAAIDRAVQERDEQAAKMVEALTLKQSFIASVWSGLSATKRELEILAAAIRGQGETK
jgi:hypothetical protein